MGGESEPLFYPCKCSGPSFTLLQQGACKILHLANQHNIVHCWLQEACAMSTKYASTSGCSTRATSNARQARIMPSCL